MAVPRALTIATSDSGGGAGIQADLKAFAAAGAHGMSVLVALTAQNTTAVTTVVTPNLREAEALAGGPASRAELAERIHARGAAAVIVTGGHGDPIDHLYDGTHHVEIPVQRHDVAATHGAGCTHSATLTACLARGAGLEEAARAA